MFSRALAMAAAVVVSLPTFAAPSTDSPHYATERAERAEELTTPYGWMSLVALQPLRPGITTVGSAADNSLVLAHAPAHLLQLEEKNGTVTVHAADSSLQIHGESVKAGTNVSTAEDEASALSSGTLKMWVIQRGDRRFLRVKDSEAPARKGFHQLNWYAPDAHYRVVAHWIPDTEPHKLKTVNKLGQVSESSIPGHVEFEINGVRQSLIPLEASADSLWFVFRDQTYVKDTDQGGRFLTAGAPSNGLTQRGDLQLDFNEAVNPPCAYSPYATCPLASPENRLKVAIPAGEKRYDP